MDEMWNQNQGMIGIAKKHTNNAWIRGWWWWGERGKHSLQNGSNPTCQNGNERGSRMRNGRGSQRGHDHCHQRDNGHASEIRNVHGCQRHYGHCCQKVFPALGLYYSLYVLLHGFLSSYDSIKVGSIVTFAWARIMCHESCVAFDKSPQHSLTLFPYYADSCVWFKR